MSSKYWCFTLKQENEDDTRKIKQLLELHTEFFIFQLESGANTGYIHYQGYFELNSKQRMSFLQRKLWKEGVHYERAKGTAEQNIEYCSKSETKIDGPYTGGVAKNKGKGARNDLAEIQKKIKEGASNAQIADEHFSQWVRYNKAFILYRDIVQPVITKSLFDIESFNHVPCDTSIAPLHFWGPTGTGKTQYALAHFQAPLLVRHMDALGKLTPKHDGIVFDDMTFLHMPQTAIIHLLDWDLPSDIHIRYTIGTIPARMPRIFTSNSQYIFWDNNAVETELVKAIRRRVIQVHIDEPCYDKI